MPPSEQTEELLRLLALPESDYWYDIACIDARARLEACGERLYTELLTLIDGISPLQQEHLAYILGESSAIAEVAILETLEKSPHSEVAFRAREALHGIYPRKA
ncbi:hypothetical protein [Chitinimonas viridis]|nr:hypothetical protein [Chitinimonas viridis]